MSLTKLDLAVDLACFRSILDSYVIQITNNWYTPYKDIPSSKHPQMTMELFCNGYLLWTH